MAGGVGRGMGERRLLNGRMEKARAMKGIVLAGGVGTRLYPMTKVLSKQLLPVWDKPLIYYPITTLMLAGIRDILLIATPQHCPLFEELLGDGSQWGISIQYAVQQKPSGLPEAFVIGREFIGDDRVALVLGDNIFFGHGFPDDLAQAARRDRGATIFAYHVRDPERYGVVELGPTGQIIGVEEKPHSPRSPWAITGLYFFDADVAELAASLRPSPRGETEITDLIGLYWKQDLLQVQLLGRGLAWLDTGTPDAMQAAASFIMALEERQGLKVACPEEIAFRLGFIDRRQLLKIAEPLKQCAYGRYLESLLR
jgi:glucose-1-phosphate thymidylyltransferase